MGKGRFKFVVWAHDDLDDKFLKLKELNDKYKWSYYHAAHEICPTTGNEHIDGYYEYDCQRMLKTELNKFNKKFGTGFGQLVIAKGSAGENMDYSEKEGRKFVTEGTASLGQGARTDLNVVRDQIIAGERTVDEVAVDEPETFHQYGRTLSKLEDIALRKKFRTEMTTCDWVYGPTGVGKSHYAFDGYSPDTHYLWKLNDNGWQDGYVGQPTVIMNDFRGEIKYNELLQMIDKWPHTVPRRSREPAPFLAKHIIITSSRSPQSIYHNRDEEDSLEQLLRRIKIIYIPQK